MKISYKLYPVWFSYGVSLFIGSRVPRWMTTVSSSTQTDAFISFLIFSSSVSTWHNLESVLPTEYYVQQHGLPDRAVLGAVWTLLPSRVVFSGQGALDLWCRGTASHLPESWHLLPSSERMNMKVQLHDHYLIPWSILVYRRHFKQCLVFFWQLLLPTLFRNC